MESIAAPQSPFQKAISHYRDLILDVGFANMFVVIVGSLLFSGSLAIKLVFVPLAAILFVFVLLANKRRHPSIFYFSLALVGLSGLLCIITVHFIIIYATIIINLFLISEYLIRQRTRRAIQARRPRY